MVHHYQLPPKGGFSLSFPLLKRGSATKRGENPASISLVLSVSYNEIPLFPLFPLFFRYHPRNYTQKRFTLPPVFSLLREQA